MLRLGARLAEESTVETDLGGVTLGCRYCELTNYMKCRHIGWKDVN